MMRLNDFQKDAVRWTKPGRVDHNRTIQECLL